MDASEKKRLHILAGNAEIKLLSDNPERILVCSQHMDYPGVTVDGIRIIGVDAKSPLRCEMQADMMGKRLTTLKTKETVCLDAASSRALARADSHPCKRSAAVSTIMITYST